MKIILNAGHTKTGKGSGAVGYLNESTETRKIVTEIKRHLTDKGHKVVLDTVEMASSQSAYLYTVARNANDVQGADLFVSIHLNAGGGRGCECYTWRGEKIEASVGVCRELNKLGFRDRGVKDGSHLYVIKKTKMPALLIEVCFLDNKNDVDLYNRLGSQVSQAISKGILCHNVRK